MKKELVYVSFARFPTEKAHGVQIAHMGEAFFIELGKGDFEMVFPNKPNPITKDASSYYDMKLPKIEYISCLSFLFSVSWWLGIIVSRTLFYLKVRWQYRNEDCIFYTRGTFAPIILNGAVIEVHRIPERGRRVFLYALKRASKIISITNAMREDLIELGIEANKILVAHDAVNIDYTNILDKDKAKEKIGYNKNQFIALYTGSFFRYSWKGVDLLLETDQYLQDNVTVVLVGATESDLKRLEHKDFSHIDVVKRVDHQQIWDYLSAADVFLLPNTDTDNMSVRYTSPLKLFEYMLVQRPIIASDITSLQEILDEDHAILVPPNSPNHIAEAISLVYNNYNQYSSYIFSKEELSHYSWKNRAKKILSFIYE